MADNSKYAQALENLLWKLDIDGVLFDDELGRSERKLMKHLVDTGKVFAIPQGNDTFSYYREP